MKRSSWTDCEGPTINLLIGEGKAGPQFRYALAFHWDERVIRK
jgi:hypothetical protein